MWTSRLRPDGVAAIVLDGGRTSSIGRRGRALVGIPVSDSPASIVFGAKPKPAAWRFGVALAAAVAVQVGAGFGAIFVVPPGGAARPEKGANPPLQIEHIIDLVVPDVSPPAPPLPVPVARAQKSPARRAAPEPVVPRDSAPSPPAEAASVIAADDDANQPLDFTGFDIALGRNHQYAGGLGRNHQYAGGVTASSGTNTQPTASPGGGGVASPPRPAGKATARSSPVGFAGQDWRCPWPGEADVLATDKQVVVLRVAVRADGSVASVELLSDPGHGFAKIAVDCARRHRFAPATGPDGRPIAATSPPIRVNFTR